MDVKHAKAQGRYAPAYGLALQRLAPELYRYAAGTPTPHMIARALDVARDKS